MPKLVEPRFALSSKLFASGAALPTAIATCARESRVSGSPCARRLPEPEADLIVKRLDLSRLDDARAVAQAVVKLRAIACGSIGCSSLALDNAWSSGLRPWG